MMVLIEIIVILLLSVLLNFRVIRLWLLFYSLLFILFFFLVSEFMLYAPLRVIGDNFYSLGVRLSYCKYNL